jgi:DNA-binding GntR family transcriptional regulator
MRDVTNGFPLDGGTTATGLPDAGAPRTSTSRMIADALRDAIVTGKLTPGAPLRQDAIARHFSVSAIPVREALRELASEGWAKIEVNKGASVAQLSAEEAREIYEIRAALESLALGLAIPKHTAQSLREITTFINTGKDERQHDPSLYTAHNEAFHMRLYAPADRPHLMEMLASLHRRGERYLRLKFGVPEYQGDSDAEHAEILAAVQRRDVAAAQALVTAHLLGTGDLIYRFLTEHGAPKPAARKTPKSETPKSVAPKSGTPRSSSSRSRS